MHVVDPRRLGFVALTEDVAAYCREHELGPDALDVDLPALRRLLCEAADRGADPARFPVGWLLRHREDGAPCPRCGGEVRKVRIGGRGAYLCPACQR